MEFKADEAAVAEAARHMVETGRLVQTGIGMSVGAHNAPLFDYLMAIPLATTSDPVLAAACIALANVAAVLLSYALGWRAFGTPAALVAAGLFALSPSAVTYARKIWAPELEPLLAVCCLYGLLFAAEDGPWWAAVSVGSWLWMCQLHPMAVLLAPVFLLAGTSFWRQALRLPLLAGVLVGLAPLLPYLAYDATHGWADVRSLLQLAGQHASLDGMALGAFLQVTTGSGLSALESVPYDHFTRYPSLVAAHSVATAVVLLLAIAIAAMCCYNGWRRKASPAVRRQARYLLVLLGWTGIPLLLSLRHSVPVYPHYELILIPAPFLIMGFAAAACAGWLPAHLYPVTPASYHALRAGGVILVVAAILTGWTALLISFFRAYPPAPFVWDYGVPYATSARIAALGRQAGPPGRLWLHTDAVIQPMLAYLLRDVPARPDLPANALVLPPAGVSAGYIFDDVHTAYIAQALEDAGATTLGRVSYLDGLHQATILSWRANARADQLGATLHPLPVRLANGVRFLGYDLSRPTPTVLRVEYAWRVGRDDAEVTTADLALYTHVLDGAGKTVTQLDGMPFPSARWQAGETIAAWFDVPLDRVAPGRYDLRAGMYLRPSVQRVPAIDATGQQRDGEFPLGTITIGS